VSGEGERDEQRRTGKKGETPAAGERGAHETLDEGFAEHVEHVKLREGGVVAVEGCEEEDVLASDLVFRKESSCKCYRVIPFVFVRRWKTEQFVPISISSVPSANLPQICRRKKLGGCSLSGEASQQFLFKQNKTYRFMVHKP
jgi:hypothetical protein